MKELVVRRMQRYIRIAFFAALVASLTGLSLGCENASSDQAGSNDSTNVATGEGDSTKTGNSSKNKRARKERTTSVRVSNTFRGDLVVPVIAEGTIRARHSAEIGTEIAGRIVRIAIDEGAYVRRGALIAKLDDREYAVAAEEAQSKYFESLSLLAIEEESLDIARRPTHIQEQIDELDKLERNGSITRDERLAREIKIDLDALKQGHYRLDVVSARSGIAAARAAVQRAKLSLERTEIRAPFSGVITGLGVSRGEQVSLGQKLCTLVNTTDIEAEVGVLESDIGHLERGREALLVVPALGDTFSVVVDVISPHFDRESRTCEVLLRVKNTEQRLRPGMFVRALIAGESFTDRLIVPKEAVLTRDGRPLVFKVDGDRAKWLYISVGEQNDHLVEVTKVLQGGTLVADDPVIVADHLTLAHDAKVKIKKTLPIRDPWTHQN